VWSDDAARGVLFLGIGFGIARFMFARLTDTVRPAAFLMPLLFMCAVSVGVAQQFPTWPGLAVTCFMFGIGSGGMAGVSLVSVMANAGPRHQMVGSTVWNLSFDVGTAIGGLSFGVMYAGIGHHAVFSTSAGFLALAVVAAAFGAARRQPSRAGEGNAPSAGDMPSPAP
jgi:predicted MFS family arabinose efflux permease